MLRLLLVTVLVYSTSCFASDPSISNCGPLEQSIYLVVEGAEKKPPLSAKQLATARTSRVELLTKSLHESTDPFFSVFRESLSARQIDPDTSILTNLIPTGSDTEFAVIILADGDVVSVEIDERNGIFEWEDITDSWKLSPYCREIDDGFRNK